MQPGVLTAEHNAPPSLNSQAASPRDEPDPARTSAEDILDTAARPFPIVGIGASAGGVEALRGFFGGVRPDSGLGYVIVTHLSPDRESLLPEIVARMTAMPVHVAADGVEVLANNVYVLPSRAILSFGEGRLRLRLTKPGAREHKPVDVFLSALATDQREHAAGVILSGGDSDGTLGVKAIKQRGGLTLAQVGDGSPPLHPDMPDSAILSGMVDFAIPVDEMGARLAEWSQSLVEGDGASLGLPAGDGAEHEALRMEICALLRHQTGHDFRGYKTKTFLRRVRRRMQVARVSSLPPYVELLRQQPAEVSALFRDLLINVTNFFRDAEAFEALETLVIPKLFEGRGADDTVRVWTPGCSTGEEAFSIAMLLREHMDGLRNVPRIQLFATDIDDRALTTARGARYPEALLEGVSPERRRRFFVADAGSYVVSKEVRDMCIFSPHNVLRDPPFSRIDLISCRNLLIYFAAGAQNHVIPTLRYSLRPGGHLFLGTSENISQFKDLFVPLDKKNRIFRAREDGGQARFPLSMALSTTRSAKGVVRSAVGGASLRQTVESYVLERHAPPHVVVSADGDVVFYSARTGKYFEAPAGAPNRQLLPMARKGMRLELRGALQEAVRTDRPAVRDGVRFEREDGRLQIVSLTVDPLPGPADERLFLVTFNDAGPPLTDEEAARAGGGIDSSAELERELRETRERLQSMIEEYETALEELKSSNEELLSVNEEMQSTNEELEASKEELQSVNEELQTVNVELNVKVEALDQANSDLHNLFESSKVATVFLDRDLSIRMFTPASTAVFKILHSDVGRPITDLTSDLDYPDMTLDLEAALGSKTMIERQIGGREADVHYLVRTAAYRGASGTAEGVVITVMDVSKLANVEAHQRTLIAELNHRVKNMLAVVLAIAHQTRRTSSSIDVFYEALAGRLRSMARAYELVSRESWTEVQLRDIAVQELAPFDADRIRVAGEPVALPPRQALSIGMILHELATNASKYGALSVEGGMVELAWSSDGSEDRRVSLQWRESGGPATAAPERRGFGLQLLEREASYNLDGLADVTFAESGVVANLDFPVRREPAP